MALHRNRATTTAFSRLELIVTFCGLSLVLFCVALMCAKNRRTSQLTQCLQNLKDLNLAQSLYMMDSESMVLPNLLSTNEGGTLEWLENGNAACHFKSFAYYEFIKPHTLTCPADIRKPAPDWPSLNNANLSYFVYRDGGVVSKSGTWPEEESKWRAILGDRNVSNRFNQVTGIINVAGDKSVGWTGTLHKFIGNIGSEDGSVTTLTSPELQDIVIHRASCRLVLP